MISVQNFYWILYEALLKDPGLDPWYFYPFGTLDNMIQCEFIAKRPRSHRHVLFYDQEPLWVNDLGSAYEIDTLSSWLYPRILANSERSDFKRNMLRERQMLDWYYFYHGFAALDWFRDGEFLYCNTGPQKPFLCLNHVYEDQRSYRIGLLVRLMESGVLDQGQVSFHASTADIHRVLASTKIWSDREKTRISSQLDQLDFLPLRVDTTDPSGDMSARFGHREYNLWQRSFLHVVTETVFYETKLHLTEKVFKPIVALRPFVLTAAPGNLAYLRSYGFRTFDQWIDESYDSILDPEERLDAISREISKICALGMRQIEDLHRDMMPVLVHNKCHFYGEFRRIIVEELVDNFDRCIRIWNNGRVDGRDMRTCADLDRVKKLLLS